MPPHLRHNHAPETIPEGVPAPETWRHYQRGDNPHGGYDQRGVSIRKSQSCIGMGSVPLFFYTTTLYQQRNLILFLRNEYVKLGVLITGNIIRFSSFIYF